MANVIKFGIENVKIGDNFYYFAQIGAVVVGFDEYISFQKIATAMTHLRNPNVHFIATNTDNQFPMGDGTFMPG